MLSYTLSKLPSTVYETPVPQKSPRRSRTQDVNWLVRPLYGLYPSSTHFATVLPRHASVNCVALGLYEARSFAVAFHVPATVSARTGAPLASTPHRGLQPVAV